MIWHVYLLRTRDGALYAGIATDIARRLTEHGGSRGAKALRARGPLVLVYAAAIGSRGLALRVEHGVKRLAKQDKESIVAARPDGAALLQMLGIRAGE